MSGRLSRRGVRLGVDVGKARVGIAKSDPDGILAVPVETADRATARERILALVHEHQAIEVVVGRPLGLSGHSTASTTDAEEFASSLADVLVVPVRLVDERLSTTQASAGLRATGHSTRSQRGIIDQAAAVIILQHSLESESLSGDAGGYIVPRGEGS